jgi:prenylcysteine alpha-carboxyl methylesterase
VRLSAIACLRHDRRTTAQLTLFPGTRERTAGATDCVWPLSRIAAFVGVSGVYTPDDPELLLHFERQGLSRAVVHAIMEAGLTGARAHEALPRASPASLALGPLAAAVPSLPPVMLCHGTADKSAPATQSAAFGAALRASGASHVMERYYQGKSHTDPFLEDPIAGGSDALLEDILTMAFHGQAGAGAPHAWPVFPRMLPDAIIQMARRCIPF